MRGGILIWFALLCQKIVLAVVHQPCIFDKLPIAIGLSILDGFQVLFFFNIYERMVGPSSNYKKKSTLFKIWSNWFTFFLGMYTIVISFVLTHSFINDKDLMWDFHNHFFTLTIGVATMGSFIALFLEK
jgi:hypothetical protein